MTAYPDVKRRLQTMTMTLLAPFYFLKAGTYVEFSAAVGRVGLIAAMFFVKVIAKIVGVSFSPGTSSGIRGQTLTT